MESQEKYNITPAAGVQEVIIRHGKAEEIHQPETVRLTGNIYAPAAFALKRRSEIEPISNKTHVIVNRHLRAILLVVNEQARDGYMIDGRLVQNPEIAALGINSESKTYSLTELQKLLKFRRFLFATPESYGNIMAALHDLKISQNRNIEASKDNRGNARNLVEQKAESNVPLNFSLTMPLYEGGEHRTFLVEIGYDVRDAGTSFWLESIELVELLKKDADEVIDGQINLLSDYATIEQ